MEGIRKAVNERNLNEGQWEDRKQWSLGVGQRRKTFWNRYIYIYIYKTLHVSDSSSVHHQEFFTVHTATVYVIQLCWRLASRIRTEPVRPDPVVSKRVWHIPLLCVQRKTPDDGQRNCPKHVEFYFKNKFEKLVHLVGFIIRIYHDARSPERHIGVTWPAKSLSRPESCSWATAVIRRRVHVRT